MATSPCSPASLLHYVAPSPCYKFAELGGSGDKRAVQASSFPPHAGQALPGPHRLCLLRASATTCGGGGRASPELLVMRRRLLQPRPGAFLRPTVVAHKGLPELRALWRWGRNGSGSAAPPGVGALCSPSGCAPGARFATWKWGATRPPWHSTARLSAACKQLLSRQCRCDRPGTSPSLCRPSPGAPLSPWGGPAPGPSPARGEGGWGGRVLGCSPVAACPAELGARGLGWEASAREMRATPAGSQATLPTWDPWPEGLRGWTLHRHPHRGL